VATKMRQKFNGNIFFLWELKIRSTLRKQTCIDAIKSKPADIIDGKWLKIDENVAANFIYRYIEEDYNRELGCYQIVQYQITSY